MALSSATIWEVRGTVLNGSPGPGSDNNGGGFVAGSGGTDFSQQNAAQVAVGGGVVTSSITTTVVTFTGGTYTVLAGDVGNIVQFISGTNVTAGFYQIASVSAGLNGTWTLDRTPLTSGTTTNAVANMGGALGGSAVNSGLAKLAANMLASNKAYVTGAFTTNATITFAQSVASPTVALPSTHLVGYGTTRGDSGRATLTLSTNTGLTGMNFTGGGTSIEQINVDCAGLGTSTGINQAGIYAECMNCKISNFTTAGLITGAGSSFQQGLEITGGTGGSGIWALRHVGNINWVIDCFIHDNACQPTSLQGQETIVNNVIANNSGASADGILCTQECVVKNNTIHNNGGNGISVSASIRTYPVIQNNVITNNGLVGLTNVSVSDLPAHPNWDGNAYFSNTGGSRSHMDNGTGIYGVSPYTNTRDVTLSVSPYVGGTTGTSANFALNNTAGGGAACRAVGIPTAWPGNTGTTGFQDMGAVQTRGSNTSPSAGGSPGIIMATG